MRLRPTVLCIVSAIGVIATASPVVAQNDSSSDANGSDSESAAEGPLKILDAKAASGGVADREPVDVGSSFSTGDKITIWMAVRNSERKETLELVWKRAGVKVASVDLEVEKSWRWRTWGRIEVATPGDWTAEINGPDGETLETVEFSVSE